MKNERIEACSRKNQNIARAAAESAYNNRRWTYSSIWAAYDRPSYYKEKAWHYCQDLCRSLDGWDLIVASKNTMMFTAVFKFEDDNGNLCYAYITKDYDRFCRA